MTTDFVTLFHQFVTTVTVNATLNVLIVKIKKRDLASFGHQRGLMGDGKKWKY